MKAQATRYPSRPAVARLHSPFLVAATVTIVVGLWGSLILAQPPSASQLHTVDAQTPKGLQELFAPDGTGLPLVSAHRGGAAKGFPENCIATFEHTLRHCWSMMEIDLRVSRDGVIVLNHDSTLDRTTSGTGRVGDHALAELKALRLKDREGMLTEYQMPTLAETLRWARGKTILVLDKKDVSVKDVVRKIEEHHAESYALLMAYSFDDIKACHALNPSIMMEVMVGDNKRFDGFEKTGVPWRNVIAFVGHSPPDAGLCARIQAAGARCMAGTSRNLDRALLSGKTGDIQALKPEYRALLARGVDVIETDIPRRVGPLLYDQAAVPAASARFFSLVTP